MATDLSFGTSGSVMTEFAAGTADLAAIGLMPDGRIVAAVSVYDGFSNRPAAARYLATPVGSAAGRIEVFWAPGAFELPLLADRIAAKRSGLSPKFPEFWAARSS